MLLIAIKHKALNIMNNLSITTFKIVIQARAYIYNKMLGDCKKKGEAIFFSSLDK